MWCGDLEYFGHRPPSHNGSERDSSCSGPSRLDSSPVIGGFETNPNKPNQLESKPEDLKHDTVLFARESGRGCFCLGHIKKITDPLKATGLLAAEAAVNGYGRDVCVQVRHGGQRPYRGNGNGSFFQSGRRFFPSNSSDCMVGGECYPT